VEDLTGPVARLLHCRFSALLDLGFGFPRAHPLAAQREQELGEFGFGEGLEENHGFRAFSPALPNGQVEYIASRYRPCAALRIFDTLRPKL